MTAAFQTDAFQFDAFQIGLAVTSTDTIQKPVNVVLIDAPLFVDRYVEFNIPAGKSKFRKITTASATARLGGKKPSFRTRRNSTGVFD